MTKAITQTIIGTPAYMAPEIFSDNDAQEGYTYSADFFSLGVFTYELLTGTTPFEGDASTMPRDVEQYYLAIMDNIEIGFVDWAEGTTISETTQQFVDSLVITDPPRRLGGGPKGIKEIKEHEFFKSLDWELAEKRELNPPYIPALTNLADTRHFDEFDVDVYDAMLGRGGEDPYEDLFKNF